MKSFIKYCLKKYSELLRVLDIESRWILRPSQYFFRPFSIPHIAKLKYSNINMDIDLSDFIGFDLFVKGAFEEHNLKAAINFGIQHKNIIDIGANIGAFGFNLADRANNILMIEASPSLCEKLNATTQQNDLKNITIINKAISDKTGDSLKLFQGKRTKGDNSLIQGTANTNESEPVITETLDDIVDRLNFQPDLIKIDVEGFESKLLKGSQNTIKRFQPAIIMEWNSSLTKKQGLSISDFIIFSDQKYAPHIITHNGELEALSPQEIANLINRKGLSDLIFLPKKSSV